jgi:uncharacterized DUF497 family protein
VRHFASTTFWKLDIARKAFADPYMVEGLDQREDYGEDRLLLTGMVKGANCSVSSIPNEKDASA